MKTWHAVAFLIVTARGRAGEPVGEFFSEGCPLPARKINAPATRAANPWASSQGRMRLKRSASSIPSASASRSTADDTLWKVTGCRPKKHGRPG